jgi:hypothetical protein
MVRLGVGGIKKKKDIMKVYMVRAVENLVKTEFRFPFYVLRGSRQKGGLTAEFRLPFLVCDCGEIKVGATLPHIVLSACLKCSLTSKGR